MHSEALAWLAENLPPTAEHVIDVGGRNINGSVRHLIAAKRWTCVDLHPGIGVDVVADVRTWEPDTLADVVVCAEVLEHSDDPAAVVDACQRILRSGGRLFLTAAAPPREPHSGLHGGALSRGEHYGNIAPADLEAWLSNWAEAKVSYDPVHGDVYAYAVA